MATSNFAVVSLGISQMKLRVPLSLYRETSCQGTDVHPFVLHKRPERQRAGRALCAHGVVGFAVYGCR